MPDPSTGPPAVGSPSRPLPPAPATPEAATGVVVFSQPATTAPAPSAAAVAPARPKRERRVTRDASSSRPGPSGWPEGSFKAGPIVLRGTPRCQPAGAASAQV